MSAQFKVIRNLSPEQSALIGQAKSLTAAFCRECGFHPLPYMAKEFLRYLAQGYEPAMLAEVINRTARAPRPSFAYLAAIMRNSYGCYSLVDFLNHSRPDNSFSRAFDQVFDSLDEDLQSVLLECVPLTRQQKEVPQ